VFVKFSKGVGSGWGVGGGSSCIFLSADTLVVAVCITYNVSPKLIQNLFKTYSKLIHFFNTKEHAPQFKIF